MIKLGRVIRDNGKRLMCATDCEGAFLPVAPYGYYAVYPENEPVAVDNYFVLGEIPAYRPQKGEILIKNSAGAYILLKNDGRVIINGKEVSGTDENI